MHSTAPLLLNVTVALAIAVAGGIAASRLRQSPILGYLLAGIVVGPFTPGFVANRDQIAALADVGVIFLMFGLGVAFSLKDLARVRAVATLGTIVQVTLTILGGMTAGLAMGVPWIMGHVTRLRSPERFIVTTAVLALGAAACCRRASSTIA
jgi:CPA2 family monovalent cation:H+ antiporter-2